jgi:soluble lytic murein transglycosylase
VSRWLPKDGCVAPDIWLDQIPLTETRKYVHRILYYASIYDWRLQHEITPVIGRMAQVLPQRGEVVAGLSCSGESISMK